MEALIAHVSDADVDSRRWAVEGLALAGTDQAIEVLLKSMHDDESPVVREHAACGLAESGMFTPEQRLLAVPQLLTYTDDSTLDRADSRMVIPGLRQHHTSASPQHLPGMAHLVRKTIPQSVISTDPLPAPRRLAVRRSGGFVYRNEELTPPSLLRATQIRFSVTTKSAKTP